MSKQTFFLREGSCAKYRFLKSILGQTGFPEKLRYKHQLLKKIKKNIAQDLKSPRRRFSEKPNAQKDYWQSRIHKWYFPKKTTFREDSFLKRLHIEQKPIQEPNCRNQPVSEKPLEKPVLKKIPWNQFIKQTASRAANIARKTLSAQPASQDHWFPKIQRPEKSVAKTLAPSVREVYI